MIDFIIKKLPYDLSRAASAAIYQLAVRLARRRARR